MSEPTSRMMDDDSISHVPHALAAIQSDTAAIGFQLASEPKTGSLLRALAASKPVVASTSSMICSHSQTGLKGMRHECPR
jgi:hypothetical protein